jgi:hypothetical protein
VFPVAQTAVAPTISASFQSLEAVGAADAVTLSVSATDPQEQPLNFTWMASGGTLGLKTDTANSSQISWTPPSAAEANWRIAVAILGSTNQVTTKTFTIKPVSCFGVTPSASRSWSWGIMADTQWTKADDGENPNSVAVDIINQVNAEFIAKSVKFVIAVGDVTDNGTNNALDVRAEFAQALYNAQIGFYPLRGNHEPTAAAATEFLRVFPQTQTALHNTTPSDCVYPDPHVAAIDDHDNTRPVAKLWPNPITAGTLLPAPTGNLAPAAGLSYAFDYANTRFLLLDQFTFPNGAAIPIGNQQPWIDSTLATNPVGAHAFVLGHKAIIGEFHTDTLFGNDPAHGTVTGDQDAFISSLQRNGVRYYIGGHDHMHNHAIVTSTDGAATVHDLISASNSSKFYQPSKPSPDDRYNVPAGRARELPITQELNTVGYYIVTMDGAKANFDFYSAVVSPTGAGSYYEIATTPALAFAKRETFGYALNGKQFVVPQGGSYAVVQDSFAGTRARILGGTNGNTNADASGRKPVKTVATGWASETCATNSAILSLWMTVNQLGSERTDTYALSLSFEPTGVSGERMASGNFGLATRDSAGNWVNAAELASSSSHTFVTRPWLPSDPLGTYGVDPSSHTAWAVIDFSNHDFSVAEFSSST